MALSDDESDSSWFPPSPSSPEEEELLRYESVSFI
jgi:hypothetical protein